MICSFNMYDAGGILLNQMPASPGRIVDDPGGYKKRIKVNR